MMRSNCDEARELIPAYSIGATDPAETHLVETALIDCPELADELADYVALSDGLNQAVPQRFAAPPAAKIFAPLQQPAAGSTTGVIPLAQPAVRRRTLWLSIAALFVVTVLGIGSNLYWSVETNRLEFALTLAQTPPPLQYLPYRLRPEDSHHRRLTATTEDQPNAQAEIIWNSDIEVGAMYATGLEILPPDMAYQLWAVRGDEIRSLGQFVVDANGTGFLIFQSPEPIISFDAMGISPEPASGSAQPTHEHVVIGNI